MGVWRRVARTVLLALGFALGGGFVLLSIMAPVLLPEPWKTRVLVTYFGLSALSFAADAMRRKWERKEGKAERRSEAAAEAKRQAEERRRNEQAREEEEKRKQAEAEAKRKRRAAKQRKLALGREWLNIMKQWHAQDQKGQPRNPTTMAMIEIQRERAQKESDPEVKAWLTDRIEQLQRQPNWIRPDLFREQADREQAAWAEAKRRKDEAERLEAQRKREEARQAQEMEEQKGLWQGTGGPPKPGRNWIRSTWPNEATDFTPWLARNLYLVSVCTGLDLRHGRTEVYAGGGRADIVARDHKSKSNVVIENQLDAADLDHRKQLALYGEALNARIRIWIAADFNSTICREIRNQNRQNESRSGGAIYYLLRLRPDRSSPISLVEGPRNSQARQDFYERST